MHSSRPLHGGSCQEMFPLRSAHKPSMLPYMLTKLLGEDVQGQSLCSSSSAIPMMIYLVGNTCTKSVRKQQRGRVNFLLTFETQLHDGTHTSTTSSSSIRRVNSHPQTHEHSMVLTCAHAFVMVQLPPPSCHFPLSWRHASTSSMMSKSSSHNPTHL